MLAYVLVFIGPFQQILPQNVAVRGTGWTCNFERAAAGFVLFVKDEDVGDVERRMGVVGHPKLHVPAFASAVADAPPPATVAALRVAICVVAAVRRVTDVYR